MRPRTSAPSGWPSSRPPDGLTDRDRMAYDELAELATMSALAKWLARWHEWASKQHDLMVNGKPGITEEKYEAVGCHRHRTVDRLTSHPGIPAPVRSHGVGRAPDRYTSNGLLRPAIVL